jgi:hypothetical protein
VGYDPESGTYRDTALDLGSVRERVGFVRVARRGGTMVDTPVGPALLEEPDDEPEVRQAEPPRARARPPPATERQEAPLREADDVSARAPVSAAEKMRRELEDLRNRVYEMEEREEGRRVAEGDAVRAEDDRRTVQGFVDQELGTLAGEEAAAQQAAMMDQIAALQRAASAEEPVTLRPPEPGEMAPAAEVDQPARASGTQMLVIERQGAPIGRMAYQLDDGVPSIEVVRMTPGEKLSTDEIRALQEAFLREHPVVTRVGAAAWRTAVMRAMGIGRKAPAEPRPRTRTQGTGRARLPAKPTTKR